MANVCKTTSEKFLHYVIESGYFQTDFNVVISVGKLLRCIRCFEKHDAKWTVLTFANVASRRKTVLCRGTDCIKMTS